MLMRTVPDSQVHGANMAPVWVLSAPDGPHVGPMNLAIRGGFPKCLGSNIYLGRHVLHSQAPLLYTFYNPNIQRLVLQQSPVPCLWQTTVTSQSWTGSRVTCSMNCCVITATLAMRSRARRPASAESPRTMPLAGGQASRQLVKVDIYV